jgi:hypothetical protein
MALLILRLQILGSGIPEPLMLARVHPQWPSIRSEPFPYHCTIHGAASMSGVIQVTPGPSPSPSPSASPSPSQSVLPWMQVSEQRDCPASNNMCPAHVGFTVEHQGAYFSGSGSSPGNVTAAEISLLDTAAQPVAASENLIGFTCVQQTTLPGASSVTVDLTYGDGSTQTIYSVDTQNQQLCFRGSKENALALFQAIDGLASKYYVEPNPEPSSSPSASVSPEPSPSPSMSGMATPRRLK